MANPEQYWLWQRIPSIEKSWNAREVTSTSISTLSYGNAHIQSSDPTQETQAQNRTVHSEGDGCKRCLMALTVSAVPEYGTPDPVTYRLKLDTVENEAMGVMSKTTRVSYIESRVACQMCRLNQREEPVQTYPSETHTPNNPHTL